MADDCPERLRNLLGFLTYILTTARSHRASHRATGGVGHGARCERLRSGRGGRSAGRRLRLASATIRC